MGDGVAGVGARAGVCLARAAASFESKEWMLPFARKIAVIARGYVYLTWKCMAHTKNGMRSNILEMFVFSPKAAV